MAAASSVPIGTGYTGELEISGQFPAEMQREREARVGIRAVAPVVELMVRAGITWDEAQAIFRVSYAAAAMDLCRQNQCRAARMIGVHRGTLHRMLEGDDDKVTE